MVKTKLKECIITALSKAAKATSLVNHNICATVHIFKMYALYLGVGIAGFNFLSLGSVHYRLLIVVDFGTPTKTTGILLVISTGDLITFP